MRRSLRSSGQQVDLLLTHLAKQTRDSLAPASRSSSPMNVIANWAIWKVMRSAHAPRCDFCFFFFGKVAIRRFACTSRCGWRRRQPNESHLIWQNIYAFLIGDFDYCRLGLPIWGRGTPNLSLCVRLIYEPYESKKSVRQLYDTLFSCLVHFWFPSFLRHTRRWHFNLAAIDDNLIN